MSTSHADVQMNRREPNQKNALERKFHQKETMAVKINAELKIYLLIESPLVSGAAVPSSTSTSAPSVLYSSALSTSSRNVRPSFSLNDLLDFVHNGVHPTNSSSVDKL